MKKLLITALIASSLCTGVVHASEVKTLSFDNIEWGHLIPARGDASPAAANLWGDRTSDGATGFLVKFKDGFSSPPHIHDVTYRGVVISGRVHNDDPAAKEMWLSAGSFWTQPAGEAHITAAEGENNIAYIEIDSGPYLVKPESEAFNNGERPINVNESNLVWLNADDIAWLPASDSSAEVAFLWGERGEGKLGGALLKLPAGFAGNIESEAIVFHAVVIKGSLELSENNKTLNAGSYFGLNDKRSVFVASGAEDEVTIYIRADGKYSVTSQSAEK
ncbi:MAG: DUF4437 domain-containing protein [Alphaproteobacteria bacterium]|nr:DUF4437 domain-containing protein [Alphaproteobacteria bacterium]